MTVNSSHNNPQKVAHQAGEFLRQLRDRKSGDPAVSADDLLLFLYRLRESYRIVGSGTGRFRDPTFGFMHELLYQLESRPDETLASEEWSEFIASLLNELASGKVTLKKIGER